MKNMSIFGVVFLLFCMGMFLLGWVINIVKLFAMFDGPVTTMFVGRIVGVFAAPLGAVLGFL